MFSGKMKISVSDQGYECQLHLEAFSRAGIGGRAGGRAPPGFPWFCRKTGDKAITFIDLEPKSCMVSVDE
jgi:hypothetical protein